MSTAKSFTRKLVGFLKFNIKLENVTGLLIQVPIGAQMYRIGGADKYPITTRRKYSVGDSKLELEVPYIPGSSLKGRIRSLLELALGKKLYTTDNKIWSHVRSLTAMGPQDFLQDVLDREVIDELFGWASVNYKQILEAVEEDAKTGTITNPKRYDMDQIFGLLAPTRLLVSDLVPDDDYVRNLNITSVADFLEEKPENRIDRVTSAADPRDIIRVRPGVIFSGTITLLLFDIDKDKLDEYFDTLLLGFKLVEETYLGSSGSRGYGRVKFVGEMVTVYKVNPPSNGVLLKKLIETRFRNLEDLENKKGDLIKAMKALYE